MKVTISSHYSDITGTTHHLIKYLEKRKMILKVLFLPLNKNKKSDYKIIEFKNGSKFVYKTRLVNNYISDFLFIIKNIKNTNFDIFVGVDPINAFMGWVLKKKLKKKFSIIFYSVDYSSTRFSNIFLNLIYRFLDTFISKKADIIWCSSERITKIRKLQNKNANKVLYVPNGTWINSNKLVKDYSKINPIEFVFVGNLGIQNDLDFLIKKINRMPNFKLHIFGIGNQQKYLESISKQNIIFHGFVENNIVLEKLKSNNWIGLAPYNNKVSHVFYGSSLKVIEYISAGLPVIVSDIIEISGKIRKFKSGWVYSSLEQLDSILEEIKTEKYNYKKFSKNSLILARKFYWSNIYNMTFKKVKKLILF